MQTTDLAALRDDLAALTGAVKGGRYKSAFKLVIPCRDGDFTTYACQDQNWHITVRLSPYNNKVIERLLVAYTGEDAARAGLCYNQFYDDSDDFGFRIADELLMGSVALGNRVEIRNSYWCRHLEKREYLDRDVEITTFSPLNGPEREREFNKKTGEVFFRTYNGKGAKRVKRSETIERPDGSASYETVLSDGRIRVVNVNRDGHLMLRNGLQFFRENRDMTEEAGAGTKRQEITGVLDKAAAVAASLWFRGKYLIEPDDIFAPRPPSETTGKEEVLVATLKKGMASIGRFIPAFGI